MTFKEENDKLINSFLERTFFIGWKNPRAKGLENFRSIEFMLNTRCNLNCSYCYYAKYGKDLYPLDLQDDKKVLTNLEILLDWMVENKFIPRMEVFSGDPLTQDVGLKAIEMILDKYKNLKEKPEQIVVPTNYTFILSDALVKKVDDLLVKSRKIGIPVFLSASIDGKYCEPNRPFKVGNFDPRDDKYYEKAFAFSKKWGFYFHPMIHSGHIEKWEKNFLWFQKMLAKYGFDWKNIYLLEVRNYDWDKKSILEFEKFIEFLIKWTFSGPCNSDINQYLNFAFTQGFNILMSPLTTTGRGLGCSIQSTIHIRMGDLSIAPCHRLSYNPFITALFKVKNGKIIGIESKNPELFLGIMSMEGKNQPGCEVCPIKEICSLGCLGSQYEVTGDPFSPIPTVCQLEHAKIRAMIKAYKSLGIFHYIKEALSPEKRMAFEYIEEISNN
jgi:radical SAM protein with 4Fe4S-binding SPASM domain